MAPISTRTILEKPDKSVDSNSDHHHTHSQSDTLRSHKLASREQLRKQSQLDQWSAMNNIVWVNATWFVLLHIGTFYGFYLIAMGQAKLVTALFAFLLYKASMLGITAGAHRLWSHRSYKARAPFRLFLALMNTVAYQNSIYIWVRDHRAHHKYSETNADHVNIERGFFFAHMGWLISKKHPDVKEYGSKINLSDVMSDPIVYYQHKYYAPLMILCCIVLPTLLPWYCWSEGLFTSFVICFATRYMMSLHITWLVNSAAHLYGNRPYDANIAPTENLFVSTFALGEGFHNYHHTFPWDYSTSEWGWKINLTTFVLDQMAKIGQVYDRRTASKEMIRTRQQRTGNSHQYNPVELEY